MSYCDLHWRSTVLRKSTTTRIILPEVGTPPYPTLYLLHGLSDDYSSWTRNTRLEQYLQKLPLIVVMPDGYRGFYTNQDQGPRYADHIALELTTMIERNFPVKTGRQNRAIGGLSMGGYGALRIGFAFADRYCSIHSHSGAIATTEKPIISDHLPTWEFEQIFGENPAMSNHDIIHLCQQMLQGKDIPEVWIDCGTNDFLFEHNQDVHQCFNQLGLKHQYHEFSGNHTWDYWNKHIPKALKFHTKNLGIKELYL